MFMKIFVRIKKCYSSNYSAKLKYYDSNKLVVGKMKDDTAGVAIKELIGLNPRIY